jgi:hypothetical protein
MQRQVNRIVPNPSVVAVNPSYSLIFDELRPVSLLVLMISEPPRLFGRPSVSRHEITGAGADRKM